MDFALLALEQPPARCALHFPSRLCHVVVQDFSRLVNGGVRIWANTEARCVSRPLSVWVGSDGFWRLSRRVTHRGGRGPPCPA